MNINWKIRLLNKTFWLTAVPAILLVIQTIAALFGFKLELGDLGNKILDVVNAVFALMTIIGVVTDPTTPTMSDSTRAMKYVKPGTPKDNS